MFKVRAKGTLTRTAPVAGRRRGWIWRGHLIALILSIAGLVEASSTSGTVEQVQQRAHAHYLRGDLEAASQALLKGLERHPRSAQLHFMLANAWYRLARWPDAIAAYRQAAELRYSHPDTHLSLGFAYLEAERVEDALLQEGLR